MGLQCVALSIWSENMRNIKLILEYDGARYFGFQRQPRQVTIQEVLEKALSRLLNRVTKIQSASGRTDTGVHALCQVVNFKTAHAMDLKKMQRGLNGLLPRDVAVRQIEEVPREFHSRYSARSKVYEYRIWNDPVRSPLKGKQSWHVPYALNLRRIRQGMRTLSGKHDFRSFCAAHSAVKDTVRTIRFFSLERMGSLLVFHIEADGFLYHMVRNLVGTLVDLGRDRWTLEGLKQALRACDRKLTGPTAPAEGLTLIRVTY